MNSYFQSISKSRFYMEPWKSYGFATYNIIKHLNTEASRRVKSVPRSCVAFLSTAGGREKKPGNVMISNVLAFVTTHAYVCIYKYNVFLEFVGRRAIRRVCVRPLYFRFCSSLSYFRGRALVIVQKGGRRGGFPRGVSVGREKRRWPAGALFLCRTKNNKNKPARQRARGKRNGLNGSPRWYTFSERRPLRARGVPNSRPEQRKKKKKKGRNEKAGAFSAEIEYPVAGRRRVKTEGTKVYSSRAAGQR